VNDADSRSRREQILADALRAADRRRRVRGARQVAGGTCICLLAIGTFGVVSRNFRSSVRPAPLVHVGPNPTSAPAPPPAPVAATTPDTPRVVVQIIPADHVERHWQVIDDDQLIAALASAGKPGGVVHLNGKAVVVPLQ
jgi:hypothetical protein